MNPSQENSRERLQQAIDAEIKALEVSTGIRALRLRRNALSPISTLPPEVFAAIFFLLCPSSPDRNPDHHLARFRVSHVCHLWREIALNQPLLWSNVNFNTLTLAGAIEMFARAKSVPLYLEARVSHRWDHDRFSTFRRELQTRIPYICHLYITADDFRIRKTLEGLVLPAPTLECLVLVSHGGLCDGEIDLVLPDTLFNGSTPRLSCLKLLYCEVRWTSPLLKGLRYLEIRVPSSANPTLAAWLDALDELSHLETLALVSASPDAPPFPFVVERTATLPSLTHLEIYASPGDCVLALAHLDLPALTELHILVSDTNHHRNSDDVPRLLPYVVRHAHGPQDTQPLQSVLIRTEDHRAEILAWSVPNIDAEVQDPPAFLAEMLPTRVTLSFTDGAWFSPTTRIELLDAAMAALPLDCLVTFIAQDFIIPDEQFWFRHAPRWPLLRHVRLAAPIDFGFKEMLLRDYGGHESPLLPSLKELVLVGSLSKNWALALTKRVAQKVPLELLDLRMCIPHGIEEHMLLCGLESEVLAPDISYSEARKQMISVWKTVARGILVKEPDFDVEESDYSYTTDDSDNDHWGDGLDRGVDEDEGDEDDEGDGEDEEAEEEWEMEED
jgi:hypothetical protein